MSQVAAAISQEDPEHQQNEDGRHTSEEQSGRVWRACLECRKKKIKCDGKDICKPCLNRSKDCVYPETNDNASTSRQLTATLEARCQQMESLCQQMDVLMGKFADAVDRLDLVQEQVLPQSFPVMDIRGGFNDISHAADGPDQIHQVSGEDLSLSNEFSTQIHHQAVQPVEIEDGNLDDLVSNQFEQINEKTAQDHVMTTDSYGKLRFVGGTGTMMMIEALKSLSPTAGAANSPVVTRTPEQSVSFLELPFFVRGKTWPRLPYLPQAEQLPRPPRYVSDLLINVFFDHLHYTMPVIYKPHFLQRYHLLMNDRTSQNVDAGFLSVFFAVCACASGLLPRELGSSSTFTGIQYFENALLIHYASTGEGTIEQVQCLALLSMCSAGWNTLAQSWKFAGAAIRAAQDLGLHRSPARGAGELLKEELCRRVWWSVYSLDRVLSICLGRPLGIEDVDCDCEMPLDLDDNDLESHCQTPAELRSPLPGPSRLTGFITFCMICQIAGRISRSVNSVQMQKMRRNSKQANDFQQTVKLIDAELARWLAEVPDTIKFSANSTKEGPHLTMCIISYILHAGCVINLHRPLIPAGYEPNTQLIEHESYLQCIGAAHSCIQIAELIEERIPPSHHLAYCAQYLALSGILLIRSSIPLTEDVQTAVEACTKYLTNIESVWTGARRSRLILEELLRSSQDSSTQRKRAFSDFFVEGTTDYMFGQDLFADLF